MGVKHATSILAAALLLALFAALAADLSQAVAQASPEVHWQSLERAQALQKAEGKPMVVFFHLSYCWRCKEMKRKVYADARVSDRLNRQFIPAEVDLAQREELGRSLGVDYVPTHLFLAPDGHEVLREKGVIALEDYLLMLDYLAGGHYAAMSFQAYTESRRK